MAACFAVLCIVEEQKRGGARTASSFSNLSIRLLLLFFLIQIIEFLFLLSSFFPLLHRGWIARHKHGNTCREVPALLRSSLFPVFFFFVFSRCCWYMRKGRQVKSVSTLYTAQGRFLHTCSSAALASEFVWCIENCLITQFKESRQSRMTR